MKIVFDTYLWVSCVKYKHGDPIPNIYFPEHLQKYVSKDSFIAYSQESLQRQIDSVSSPNEECSIFYYILKDSK